LFSENKGEVLICNLIKTSLIFDLHPQKNFAPLFLLGASCAHQV